MSESRVTGGAPVFLVSDVVASANFYRDQLGFSYERLWGDPPCFCIVNRDNVSLMLSQVDSPDHIQPNSKFVKEMWNAYFWVSDIESEYDARKSAGTNPTTDIMDKEYGCREFEVVDPDGYVIVFGEVVD